MGDEFEQLKDLLRRAAGAINEYRMSVQYDRRHAAMRGTDHARRAGCGLPLPYEALVEEINRVVGFPAGQQQEAPQS